MPIVNLTGFTIRLHEPKETLIGMPNQPIIMESDGEALFCANEVDRSGIAYGDFGYTIEVVNMRIGTVIGLPDPTPDTIYVVMPAVAMLLHSTGSTRTDVYCPSNGMVELQPGYKVITCFRLTQIVG